MAKPRVNPTELQRLLDTGHSQADAAAHFNVRFTRGLALRLLQIARSRFSLGKNGGAARI